MGAGLLPSRALFWGGSLCSGQGKSRVHSLRTIMALLYIRKHSYKFRKIPENLGSIQTQNSKQATEFKGFWGSSSKTYYSPLLPVQPEASERIALETIPLKPEKSVFSRCSWRGCGAGGCGAGSPGARVPPTARCSAAAAPAGDSAPGELGLGGRRFLSHQLNLQIKYCWWFAVCKFPA